MIAFLFCLLLFAATTATARSVSASFPKGLLIDGQSVGIEGVPYLAIIQYGDRPICGGVIISRERILTAAHCFRKYRLVPEMYKVRIGSSLRNVTTDGQYLQIRYVKLHESFTGAYENTNINGYQVPANNLAMIITEPMELGPKSKPIALFDEAEYVQEGTNALVTGWRRVNGSELLKTKIVRILRTYSCDTNYYQSDIPAGQICAELPGPSEIEACLGDSGGPLVIGGRLAGILSWGNGCAKSYGPGLYTSIPYYRDWIDNGGRDVYSLP